MARIALSETGSTPWERLLGNVPPILEKWGALENAFMSSSTFSDDLREQVRRALDFGNGRECASQIFGASLGLQPAEDCAR